MSVGRINNKRHKYVLKVMNKILDQARDLYGFGPRDLAALKAVIEYDLIHIRDEYLIHDLYLDGYYSDTEARPVLVIKNDNGIYAILRDADQPFWDIEYRSATGKLYNGIAIDFFDAYQDLVDEVSDSIEWHKSYIIAAQRFLDTYPPPPATEISSEGA